jgi:hypothetical protein
MSRIALALVLFTTAAHAGNHEISVTETNRALRTSSANAVTEDSLIGGALAYAYNLGEPVVPGIELWATTTFGWGGAEGTMFQTLHTELDTLAFAVGARARYTLLSRIVASARVDIGTTRAALELHDDNGHSAADHGWGAMTAASVGLDLYAILRDRFSLAVRAELGAVATSSIPLSATPDGSREGTLQLEMTAASLGSLNLSGPTFGVSLVGQF